MSSPPSSLQPLTNAEVQTIARELQMLVGAQLQEFWQLDEQVGLGFYHERSMVGLLVTLTPQAPLIVRVSGVPKGKKLMRPLTLFARSRFTGRRLKEVSVVEGRILLFKFHRSKDEEVQGVCEIEVRLFPHGQNVFARDGKSQVAEFKPRDLPASAPATVQDASGRTWEEIEYEWAKAQAPAKPKAEVVVGETEPREVKEWRKAIAKKEKAIEQMRSDLERKLSPMPAKAGHWLKTQLALPEAREIPEDLRAFVDVEKSLAENIETNFRLAKENTRKAEGARTRIEQVQGELAQLRERGPRAMEKLRAKQDQHRKDDLLARAEAKGRRFKAAEDLDVFIGKSAADNLALLRRAQPFDYWLHLRERPGSHAIMRRTRTRNVTDAEFREAGQWVVEQSLGKRVSELKGEAFDLLIVECRFVRPIKGDSLGRVHYTNDRVMRLGF